MRVFLTGGTGFIGGRVAGALRARGDEVVALVRSAEKGSGVAELGCELVVGDLADGAVIAAGLEGCDAAIHGAAVYEVGIPPSERPRMHEANVVGTENVLRACLDAATAKVVYISTIGAYGNTHGEVVDETYEHRGESFTSADGVTFWASHDKAMAKLGYAPRGLHAGLRDLLVAEGKL